MNENVTANKKVTNDQHTFRIWLFNNVQSIIIALIGIMIGMGGLYLKFYESNSSRDDNYIEKYVSCIKEIAEVKEEVLQIKARLLTLEVASQEIPFPYWVKDINGIIIHVSRNYEEIILKPLGINSSQFLNTKGEILGEEFVKMISKNDAEVLLSNTSLKFREKIPGIGKGTSYKFPIKSNYQLLGTAGIWIPDE